MIPHHCHGQDPLGQNQLYCAIMTPSLDFLSSSSSIWISSLKGQNVLTDSYARDTVSKTYRLIMMPRRAPTKKYHSVAIGREPDHPIAAGFARLSILAGILVILGSLLCMEAPLLAQDVTATLPRASQYDRSNESSRGGSGSLDRIFHFISGAWRYPPTQPWAVQVCSPSTRARACVRQARDAA